MITKLVDRMIGQEILESEKRDEYIYALTIRAEQVITYTLLAMVCLWTHNILEGLIYAVAFKGYGSTLADIMRKPCLVVWWERLRCYWQ